MSSTTPHTTAGIGNNVEKNYGETAGEKKGFMDKVKEKILPDGPGKTEDTSGTVQYSTSIAKDGRPELARDKQGGADLNRE